MDEAIARSTHKPGYDELKNYLFNHPEQVKEIRECLLSGPDRGDCRHSVGLPDVLNETTTDSYGRPHDWCQICWDGEKLKKVYEMNLSSDETKRQANPQQPYPGSPVPTAKSPEYDPSAIQYDGHSHNNPHQQLRHTEIIAQLSKISASIRMCAGWLFFEIAILAAFFAFRTP